MQYSSPPLFKGRGLVRRAGGRLFECVVPIRGILFSKKTRLVVAVVVVVVVVVEVEVEVEVVVRVRVRVEVEVVVAAVAVAGGLLERMG